MRRIITGLATLLIAGFFGAALIRFGPGYESDERDLDARYSTQSAEAIAQENSRDSNVLTFYGRYLSKAMQGDFGTSRAFSIPVGELIRSRSAVTARLLAQGLLVGWTTGLFLAALATYFRFPSVTFGAETISAFALSLPAAIFALIIFLARGPIFLALALVVFPRVFRYGRDLFEAARTGSRVEAARARGVREINIFRSYIARPSWPPLIALAGVSFSIAFGALIPVEVVCDIPGIGHLAWKAAQARDLPVLVTLTLLVTAITIAVNAIAETFSRPGTGRAG